MAIGNETARNRPAADRWPATSAEAHAPFLRELIRARPEIAGAFTEQGADAAAALALEAVGEGVEQRLRRQRGGLALSVALGDLSGELALERVTSLLSDFADRAIDEALEAALTERVPDATQQGFAVIAMGKLGSHELNYSSDVDLLLLSTRRPCLGASATSRARRPSASGAG